MLRLGAISYVLGVSDELPSKDALRDFMEPVRTREGVRAQELRLDGGGPLDMPPAVGQVGLALLHGDAPLATIDAFQPEMQWDWDVVTARVLESALEPFSRLSEARPGGAP